jgi:tripartite-type tricarboxylate transporter receptor subunit TctC
MSKKSIFTIALCALLAGANAAWAWPDKPVKIVVPFAPGGATDVVARAMGQRLGEMWKQPVVIENKPGAGGNIGADLVAKAPPDGHTLLLASPAEVVINAFLYKSMPFDPQKDLAPVAKIASAPLALVVHPSVPAKTMPELLAYLKANPGTPYASSGTGGPQHLAGEWFRVLTKTDITHVPYKGGAPAIVDLLGGQVRMFFSGLPPALPHIQAGRLRVIAISTAAPSSLMDGVPTVAATVPGFDVENWQGLFAPAGTPSAVIAKVAADAARVAQDKSYQDQLKASGAAPAVLAAEAFSTFLDSERRKYRELVQISGAKAD